MQNLQHTTECLQYNQCNVDVSPVSGISVLAFCLVTNQCQVSPDCHTSQAPSHQEVLDAAASKERDLRKFVSTLVQMLAAHLD